MDQSKLILDAARSCINIELEALEKLHQSFNSAFVEAVQCIYQGKGRLVITGAQARRLFLCMLQMRSMVI